MAVLLSHILCVLTKQDVSPAAGLKDTSPQQGHESKTNVVVPPCSSPLPAGGILFYSFFKSLVGKDVVVELKNDLSICGRVRQLGLQTEPEKVPHMLSLQADEVDTQLLQDAARKEAMKQKQ
uniref:Uncharacterized protein n=1 Tax=Terrapene triunguis TaxID=2587831 RepID=A0A674I2N8_9SAUR